MTMDKLKYERVNCIYFYILEGTIMLFHTQTQLLQMTFLAHIKYTTAIDSIASENYYHSWPGKTVDANVEVIY